MVGFRKMEWSLISMIAGGFSLALAVGMGFVRWNIFFVRLRHIGLAVGIGILLLVIGKLVSVFGRQ